MPAADWRKSWLECQKQVRIHAWNLSLICFAFSLKFASDFLFSLQRTALHLAASNGHTQACQLLIHGKADLNAKSMCAFMFEICCWFCFVLRFWNSLLTFICSSDQYTALHYAASNGRTQACQLLIDGKADLNAKSRCAFMHEICHWFFVVFFSCLSLTRLPAVKALRPSSLPSKRTSAALWHCCAALALPNKRFFWPIMFSISAFFGR